MRRVLMTRSGVNPSAAVEVVEDDEPVPGEGEVIVAVAARPINPADLLLLEGRHLFTPSLPAPVGIEGAGVVVAAGPGAGLPVGARVAVPFGGTWTERMAVSAEELIVVPDEVSLEQASMLSVNPFTAAGLLEGLSTGDWLVQNAGGAAVARWVTALAARRGVRTISVVRRVGAEDELLALGAEAVLVGGPDLADRVRALTDGGAARALDAVAGEASGRLHACLRDDGELVVYGLLASDQVMLPAAPLIFRGVVVRGFSRLRILQAMSPERRAEIGGELLALIATDDRFSTTIEARYPLHDVRLALAHHQRPNRRGKVLLMS